MRIFEPKEADGTKNFNSSSLMRKKFNLKNISTNHMNITRNLDYKKRNKILMTSAIVARTVSFYQLFVFRSTWYIRVFLFQLKISSQH